MKGLHIALLLLALTATTSTAASPKLIVCYYGSWATYRAYPAILEVSAIDTTLCTHVVYAFAGLDEATGTIISLDPYNDLEENSGKGNYRKFAALADEGTRPILAVGGWNEGSTKYSQMASTAEGRSRFAESAVSFLQQYAFLGLNLDWQYPASRGGVAADRQNFALLCQELYGQLSAAGLTFSISAGAGRDMTLTSYDVPAIVPYVDFVNLMTYDYYTASSSSVTGMVAPLFPSSDDGDYLNVEATVQEWLSAGATAEKLVVGVPFFGRSYTLQDPSSHGVGAPSAGPGDAGPYTQEAGVLSYLEICMSEWTETVVDNGDVYAYNGDQWVSFKNADTVEAMGQYVEDRGLGGLNVWSIESDDTYGVCGAGSNPLLVAVDTGVFRS